MIMNKPLISLTALTKKLLITPEFESWLLSAYDWEPYDDFWTPEDLIDLIMVHYKDYTNGQLDISIPAESDLWKNRAETVAYILKGITLEKDALIDENRKLIELLKEQGIEY